MQFDHNGGLLGGAGDVHTIHYVSRYVHSRSEVWTKAQSTVGESKLHSQTEGACDTCSRAHPPQKEKTPVAYDRVIGHWSVLCMVGCHWTWGLHMDAIGCGDCVWMPLDVGIAYGCHWTWKLHMDAIGCGDCVWEPLDAGIVYG